MINRPEEFNLPTCSCVTESDLYSATSMNFLGSEPVVLRSSFLPLRTETNSNWLNSEFDSAVTTSVTFGVV